MSVSFSALQRTTQGTQLLPQGIVHWLDAQATDSFTFSSACASTSNASSIVQTWGDSTLSGNGMSVSFGSPTYNSMALNGKPGVTFSSARMTSPALQNSSNATLAIVMNIPTSTLPAKGTIWGHFTNVESDLCLRANTTTSRVNFHSGNISNGGSSLTITQDTATIWLMTITNGVTTYIEATPVGSTKTTATNTVAISTNTITSSICPIYIGASGAAEYGNAIIGEVIYYQRVLNASELTSLATYLQRKWANALVVKYPVGVLSSTGTNTTYTLTVSSQTYILSASEAGALFSAFDRSISTQWTSGIRYAISNTSGAYTRTPATTTTTTTPNYTSVSGEWLQIKMPTGIVLAYYSITGSTNGNNPVGWVLTGSNDGTTWNVIDVRSLSNESWLLSGYNTSQFFPCSGLTSYMWYRMIFTNIVSTTGAVSIAEWQLFASTPLSVASSPTSFSLSTISRQLGFLSSGKTSLSVVKEQTACPQSLYFRFTSTLPNTATTSPTGPSLASLQTSYASLASSFAGWDSYLNTNLAVSQGIQLFTVPVSGNYTLIAAGAAGGTGSQSTNTFVGGRGVIISTTVALVAGEVIKILVGQMGVNGGTSAGGGGGGGTFVATNDNIPILVAGGGGGGGGSSANGSTVWASSNVYNGTVNTSGQTSGTSGLVAGSSGNGGTNQSPAAAQTSCPGGGFYTDATYPSSTANRAFAFINGGGTATGGGFGGGGRFVTGGGGGGGGGYSGGATGNSITTTLSGGGGSYDINGRNRIATLYTDITNGYNNNHGFVIIQQSEDFLVDTYNTSLYPLTAPPLSSQFMFTPGAATGTIGPTIAQMKTAYAAYGTATGGTSTMTTYLANKSGIQRWTVPGSGWYEIIAAGASGGGPTSGSAGKGIVVSTTASLQKGEQVQILCGHEGGGSANNYGGGSGTYVASSDRLLLVAGGGGGLGSNAVYTASVMNATTSATTTDVTMFPYSLPFTFNTGGQTGITIPSLSQMTSTYSTNGFPWTANTAYFNMNADNGIQLWTVPATGTYQIIAAGANGGNNAANTNGGRGIIVSTTVSLTSGQIIKILVGQRGARGGGINANAGGGGGGSFVAYNNNTPILVAGGGGGRSGSGAASGNGILTTTGTNTGTLGNAGSGGNGSGFGGCGGAGFYGNYSNTNGTVVTLTNSFVNGGNGQVQGTNSTPSYNVGGFGCGGACDFNGQGSGGGGGYSGGNAAADGTLPSYGGGSYDINGVNNTATLYTGVSGFSSGLNTSSGFVIISFADSLLIANGLGGNAGTASGGSGGAGAFGYGSAGGGSATASVPFILGGTGGSKDGGNTASSPFGGGGSGASGGGGGGSGYSGGGGGPGSTGIGGSGGSSFDINGVNNNATQYTGTDYESGTGLRIGSGYVVIRNITSRISMSKLYKTNGQFEFTNCGASGAFGPSLNQMFSTYARDTWVINPAYLSSSNGIQLWTVPASGNYKFIAAGAAGGNTANFTGGRGVIVSTTVALTAGEVIKILVGQRGRDAVNNISSGGGGTFIATSTNTPILVAGGGGGNFNNLTANGSNASLTTNGTNGTSDTAGGTNGGAGGTAGNGDQNAGAGFYGNAGVATDAQSFINGGSGNAITYNGGFGGGGMGGGGYSGGGGISNGAQGPAGGGGSYDVNGSSNTATLYTGILSYPSGYNTGHGFVYVSLMPDTYTVPDNINIVPILRTSVSIPCNASSLNASAALVLRQGVTLLTPSGTSGSSGPTSLTAIKQASYTRSVGSNYILPLINLSAGIIYFTVPVTGTYNLVAAGAAGGDAGNFTGGKGVVISTTVTLDAGQILKILVGQKGRNATTSSGGGGTFIATAQNTPILVAGGGGGNSNNKTANGLDASLTTSGLSGTSGAGGTDGSAGSQAGNSDLNAGAGFYGNTGTGIDANARSFIDGGGGNTTYVGGFGGGGLGGGGYSGGGGISSGSEGPGGGGGSYDINGLDNSATLYVGTPNYSTGYNTGDGFAEITLVNDPITYNLPVGFTIGTCNSTGSDGPSLEAVRDALSIYPFANDVLNKYIHMTVKGIILLTIPQDGNYTFIAAGAAGGNTASFTGGRGVVISTTVALLAGQVLKILVGQKGRDATISSGGGGTFIATANNTPILVAGGGGGIFNNTANGSNASVTTSGTTGTTNTVGGTNGSAGGTAGNGDQNAGAGFYGNAGVATDAQSFINGGSGNAITYNGGFGGGGMGGGGYSGGGGISNSAQGPAGGGGSYDINGESNTATLYTALTGYTTGYNSGDGFVIVSAIAAYDPTVIAKPASFPPVALTSGTQTVSGQSYGNGQYIVTSSSGSGFLAFNRANGADATEWISTPGTYATTGFSSVDPGVGDATVKGEWIQMQFPQLFELVSFVVRPSWSIGTSRQTPQEIKIYGSNNGTTWQLVHTQPSLTSWTNATDSGVYMITSTNKFSYTYFRFVVSKSNGSTAGMAVSIAELSLTGRMYSTKLTSFVPVIQSSVDANATNFSATLSPSGSTGATGPTLAAVIQSIVSNPTDVLTNYLGMGSSQGIVLLTIPQDGNYTFIAAGAGGGNANGGTTNIGGLGVIVSTTIFLAAGQIIEILVGQKGTNGPSTKGGAGGGGTFISTINNDPILIAAGGGGAGTATSASGGNAFVALTGTGTGTSGASGTAGDGTATGGIRGAGFLGSFIGATYQVYSFVHGGKGTGTTVPAVTGSFGGGGGAPGTGGGGGGGYNGGSGGLSGARGGGGGSYDMNGANFTATSYTSLSSYPAGTNSGDGFVIVSSQYLATSLTMRWQGNYTNVVIDAKPAIPSLPATVNTSATVTSTPTTTTITGFNQSLNYILTATPYDASGAAGNSLETSITNVSSFSPISSIGATSTCILWLDGNDVRNGSNPMNGENVSSWTNKSSSGFFTFAQTTVANQPVFTQSSLNFKGGITFKTAGTWLSSTLSSTNLSLTSSAYTMFIVVSNFTGGAVWLRGSSSVTAWLSSQKKFILANSVGITAADELTVGARPYIVGPSQNQAIDNSTISTTASIIVIQGSTSSPRITYYSSTNVHSLAVSTFAPTTENANSTHFHIGTASLSTPFNGTINEFLIYKGTLRPVDRVAVTGYLANKWGIASS